MLQQYSLYKYSTRILRVFRGNRCSIPRRHITAGLFPDLNHDAPTKEAQFTFQPDIVPAIRNALFKDDVPQRELKSHASLRIEERLNTVRTGREILRAVQKNILSHEDHLHLCSVCPYLIKALKRCSYRSTAAEALCTINAIIARFKYVGVALPLELLQFAMLESIRGKLPAVVMAYISMMVSENKGKGPRLCIPITRALATLVKQQSLEEPFQGWDGQCKKQEWLCIIQVMLSEWDQAVGSFEDGEVCPRCPHFNTNFNRLVQAFLNLGEPKLAWQVVKRYNHRFGPLKATNWHMLLEHPDGIEGWSPALVRQLEVRSRALERETFKLLFIYPELTGKWTPDMDGPAKVELERQLKQIENILEIKWKGGEDGFHELK